MRAELDSELGPCAAEQDPFVASQRHVNGNGSANGHDHEHEHAAVAEPKEPGLDFDVDRLELRMLAMALYDERAGEISRSLGAELFTSAATRTLFVVARDWYASTDEMIDVVLVEARLVEAGLPTRTAFGLTMRLDEAFISVAGHKPQSLLAELQRRHARRQSLEYVQQARLALAGASPDLLRAQALLARVLEYEPANDVDEAGNWTPTHDDPLSGLPLLSKLAMSLRQRYVELAAQPVVYTWQDILVAGTIGVLAGASGSGKTTLMYLYACARAQIGHPINLLGRDVVPAPFGQHLVIIEAEHSERSAARKLMTSLRLLQLDDTVLEDNRIITIARKAVLLGSPAWREVVRLIEAGLVSDLIIDTIARVAPADANEEAAQVSIYEQIAQALESAPEGSNPPTCLILAHLRKGSGGDDAEEVSGSAQRVGQSDTTMIARATREDGRVVSTRVSFQKLREEPKQWPVPYSFAVRDGRLVQEAAPTKTDDKATTSSSARYVDVESDARTLMQLLLAHPRIGSRDLRSLAKEKCRWGVPRLEAAKARLVQGLEGWCLANVGDESTHSWVVMPANMEGNK